MYLPHCYYTPGEYFFLLLCVCSFNARRFSRPGDMMAHHGSERERESKKERRGLFNSQSEVHVVRAEQVCSTEWFTSCHPVYFLDHSGARGPLAALFSLSHKFGVCASSVLYVCKCCQRKKRAGPRHTCI